MMSPAALVGSSSGNSSVRLYRCQQRRNCYLWPTPFQRFQTSRYEDKNFDVSSRQPANVTFGKERGGNAADTLDLFIRD